MSEMLKKNLKVMEINHKDAADQIRMIASSESRRYSVVKGANGEPNLFDKMTNSFVYDNAKPLSSALSDVRNNKTYLNRLVYFIGFGLGHHMKAFVETHPTDSSLFIFIYEADAEVLFHAMSTTDFTALLAHQRCVIITGAIDEQNLSHNIKNLFNEKHSDLKYYIKATTFVETPYLYGAYKDRYAVLFRAIKSAYTVMLNHYGNDPGDSLIGIVNTIKNIDIILKNPGIDVLGGKFKGRVGVVVSTGPSLKKNLHLLKDIQDEVVIISVDASVKILQEYGIKPHAVTSLERVLETAKLFDDVDDDFVADTVFTACPVVRPETYANFAAKPVIVYREFATFKWLGVDRGPLLSIGPSSSNMAFCLLEYLGCDTIVLLGQDFAYSPDGLTHAEGTTYGSQQDKQFAHAYIDLEVEGNYVPTLRTTQVWDLFRKYMEQDAMRFEGTTINATEGGAKIHGTTLMTFAETIEKYVTPKNYAKDIPDIFKKSVQPMDDATLRNDFMQVKRRISQGAEYCRHIMEEYQKVIDINDKIEARSINIEGSNIIDPIRLNELYTDVQKIMINMSAEQNFYLIVMHYVQPYFIHILMDLYGIKNTVSVEQERALRFIKLSSVAAATMIQLVDRLEQLLSSTENTLSDPTSEAELLLN